MDTLDPGELPPDYDDDDGGDFHANQRTTVLDNSADLSKLPDLSENIVLQVVKNRYQRDQIYTCCGDVLISVNPYKPIPIFDQKAHEAFSLGVASSQEPHVFRTAREAISRRARDKSDQVVLVSGESGAGKTEATKLMLKHILYLSASHKDELYESIEKVNPLIELFGNARTTLNENSSRFAKFLEVKFSQDGGVCGAIIRDYILEKSRVVSPSEGESNFHIFYTFLDDVMANPEQRTLFLMDGMNKMTGFRIVPPSSWHRNVTRMTRREQKDIFRQIGLQEEEVHNLYVVLAAILHLTNIEFEDDDSSSGGVVVENEATMNKAAALLNVSPEKLATVLVTTTKTFRGQEILTCKSHAKARETRDAIAKALYERLFGWLIRRINNALSSPGGHGADIGFLDICGFEVLHQNSLEQMCINLANENLQRFMNKYLFQQEMKIYQEEQLKMGDINPPSNDAILDMFDQPKFGILALIDEDTRVEISTEESMVRKLIDNHAQSDHFLRYKNSQPRFGIRHFAGTVWYSADNFLEKNGDALSKEVKDALVASSNELVSDIFQVQKAPTGSIAPTHFNYRVSQKHDIRFQKPGQVKLSTSMVRGLHQSLKDRFGEIPKLGDSDRTRFSQENTVIGCFKASMKDLLSKMGNANPLFVRCIKPNDKQAPDKFEDQKVVLQLRYNGVTEIARIRRLGFPVRMEFSQFIERYCSLAKGSHTIPGKPQAITAILQQCGVPPDLFRIGKSKIFLRDEASRALEGRKEEEDRRKREEEDRRKREEELRRLREAETKKNEEEEQTMPLRKNPLPSGTSALKDVMTLEPVQEVSTPMSSVRTNGPSLASSSQESMTSSSTSGPEEETAGKEGRDSNSSGSSETQEDSKNNFWDIFRIVAREKPATDIHHMTAMRIIKLLVYILIFCVVLATSTAQKVSLMLMIAASNMDGNEDEKNVSSAYYILLAIAICIPYILTFLTSAAKVAFGGFSNPSFVTWIWVIVIELLHTFGLSLLVFRVLPRLDVVNGLLFLSAVATVPSILKPITGVIVSQRKRQHLYIAMNWILDVLAILGQLSVFPVVFLLYNFGQKNQEDVTTILDVIGALVLVSLSCWENFVDGRFFVELSDGNPWKNFFLKRKFELERGRYIPHLVTSPLKIVLTIGLAYGLRDNGNIWDHQAAFEALSSFQTQWKAITAICVLTLSGVVCYYMSYIACKLWMQKISFVIPATLATPCAILVFFLNYKFEFLANVTSNSQSGELRVTWPGDLTVHWRTIVPGVAWWISLVLLTRYVWFPRQSRLAKIEMLFMNPLYCGILTIETLLLNRRRHTLSALKRRSWLEGEYYYCLSRQELTVSDDSDYAGESDAHTYAQIDDVERNASADTLENPDSSNGDGGGRRKMKQGEEEIPMIYACATMWHEVRREMVALLKSLHRLDQEQWIRKQAQEMSGTKDKDYFEYEAHIFFDDAMTLDDKEEFIPNDYVKMVVEVMEEAASSVYKRAINVSDPIKIPTPYGGQLLWVMPCGNLLFVHLKDKAKIRHRKRWSQVMYMYYLLGFRLTRQCEEQIIQALSSGQGGKYAGWNVDRSNVYGSDIFDMLSDSVARKSQNTFVMALDGDTDFSPGAVHILLDRMKKNPKVGAACGRIHPIGSGPMVWYQMFEYAVGHWMQKATEHVLGCVLCSPGCFSLFRGSALMDDNVMKMYTILPTEPSHFLQYDQGEDRWLCTLLLQQGYRVDYAAAADAWTYAPEGFNEFFNQRRRWMPSTLANVMDLLSDYSNTVAVNSNISMLYIAYQVALMVSTLIGPGTVLLMIAGAIGTVFRINLVWSYVFALVPAIIYVLVCMNCKPKIQLYLAAVLSAFYAFVMMIVFVGIIVIAVKESVFHPTVIITVIIAMIFIFAGLCHPMEIFCLPSGALYLLCIPSGYLLLVIYSLCNLHVVSWGTREAPKKKTKAELEQEEIEKKKKEEEKAKKKGFFSRFFFSSYLSDLKDIIQNATGNKNQTTDRSLQLLEEINENIKKLAAANNPGSPPPTITLEGVRIEQSPSAPIQKKKKSVKISKKTQEIPDESKPERDELKNPKWLEDKALGKGPVMELFEEELQFWQAFIKRYLKPLDADKKKEEEDLKGLLELRTNVVFAVCMVNLLWIAINFMFQFNDTGNVRFNIDGGVNADYLGLLFLFFLGAILLLQVMGMIVHRWGTLLHLLAFTDIELPCLKTKPKGVLEGNVDNLKKAMDFCKQMITDPPIDYGPDDNEEEIAHKSIRERLRATMLGTQQLGTQSVVRQLDREGMSVTGTDFLNSRAVNMYLRGTQRAGIPRDEEDLEARRFVDAVRSGEALRSTRRYIQNGDARSSGYAPALPTRQNSAYNDGVRRRLIGTNFGLTVNDTIQQLMQNGIDVKPEDGVGWGGGGGGIRGGAGGFGGRVGGGIGGGFGGGYTGQMDKYFNRQVRNFKEHVSVHGRDAFDKTVSSRHFERDRASRYRRQQQQPDYLPV